MPLEWKVFLERWCFGGADFSSAVCRLFISKRRAITLPSLPFTEQFLFCSFFEESIPSADAQGEENKSHAPNFARARNSGNAPNWSSTNSLNVSSGMRTRNV
jgi:hypothetical protein